MAHSHRPPPLGLVLVPHNVNDNISIIYLILYTSISNSIRQARFCGSLTLTPQADKLVAFNINIYIFVNVQVGHTQLFQ